MTYPSINDRVREHALTLARDKGWKVLFTDCTVTPVRVTELHLTGQVAYWTVKLLIRADLNKRRALIRDGLISGMVRLSGDSLLDTLAESPETLQARLAADGQL